MGRRPLTKELESCLEILQSVCWEMERVLPPYLASHQNGLQHQDAAEAQLFCQNLRHHLHGWNPMAGEEEMESDTPAERLQHLVTAAAQAEALAGAWDRHQGDFRLDHALTGLAECLRLTMPSLLRWTHGAREGQADRVLAERAKQIRQGLESLLSSLPAA